MRSSDLDQMLVGERCHCLNATNVAKSLQNRNKMQFLTYSSLKQIHNADWNASSRQSFHGILFRLHFSLIVAAWHFNQKCLSFHWFNYFELDLQFSNGKCISSQLMNKWNGIAVNKNQPNDVCGFLSAAELFWASQAYNTRIARYPRKLCH